MQGEIKPGYKQTEVGVIPEDWEVKPLPSVLEFIGGKAHEQHIRPYGDYVVVNSKFISSDGQVAKYSDHNFCPARRGDILMVMSDLPNGKALAKCFVVDRDQTYAVNQRICILRPKKSDSHFFFYLLNRNPYFMAFDDGVQQTHLLNGVFRACPVVVPPTIEEQRAIAGALADADALIAALEGMIAKKRDLKQAAMQHLLTGKTRLPGFSGEWEVKRLGEIGYTYGGLTGKSKVDFGHGSAKYITFMNIMTNVLISPNGFENVDVSANENQNRTVQGDLFFNGSSETPEEVGMCSLLAEEFENLYLNSFCFGFRLRDQQAASGLYLAYYFRSSSGRELLSSLAQGATRYNLSKRALMAVQVKLPTSEEQTAIAEVLSDMDADLDALEAQAAKARAVKQGMMQELLTGRVRLL